MNSLYETIKKYGSGKGEEMMWKSVSLISKAVDEKMEEKDKERLVSDVYALMSGKHYDEEYAMKCVSTMYYTDKQGVKHFAPYWTREQVKPFFDSAKAEIPEYNCWDYFVTFNMVASDNWNLYHKWWPDITAEQFAVKIAEATLNWLKDEDKKDTSRIWDYMHIENK